jgi:uncharacterized protein (TIGR02266 family)
MYHVASEETYEDGALIFREEAPGDWVYIILSGSVEIFKKIDDKDIVIEILQEGEIFGELGFLGRIKRTAGARAVGPTTLGVIDRAFLDAEFNKLSSEFRSILVAVVKRFKKMLERARDFEGRREPRAQKTLSLAFRDRNAFVKAFASNVSAGGLFVRTRNPLPVGERFLLKLQLPGITEPLEIQCEVSWSRGGEAEGEPAGMGLRFLEMSPDERQALKLYVDDILRSGQGR